MQTENICILGFISYALQYLLCHLLQILYWVTHGRIVQNLGTQILALCLLTLKREGRKIGRGREREGRRWDEKGGRKEVKEGRRGEGEREGGKIALTNPKDVPIITV